jgi:hypothetical protein
MTEQAKPVVVVVISRDGSDFAVYRECTDMPEFIKIDKKNGDPKAPFIFARNKGGVPVVDLRPLCGMSHDIWFPICAEVYPRHKIGPKLKLKDYLSWYERVGAAITTFDHWN